MRAARIFTGRAISPSSSLRQRASRYTFRADRNLPDKEFRYFNGRTVIVTAAVHQGFYRKPLIRFTLFYFPPRRPSRAEGSIFTSEFECLPYGSAPLLHLCFFIGLELTESVRVGSSVGQGTLSSFCTTHTFLLPVVKVILMLAHLMMVRKQEISGSFQSRRLARSRTFNWDFLFVLFWALSTIGAGVTRVPNTRSHEGRAFGRIPFPGSPWPSLLFLPWCFAPCTDPGMVN